MEKDLVSVGIENISLKPKKKWFKNEYVLQFPKITISDQVAATIYQLQTVNDALNLYENGPSLEIKKMATLAIEEDK